MSTDYNHGFRSVYKLTAHVVFVVKYRRKAISNEILARLKEIFASTLTKWESALLDFNGESDHVHLIIDYKPDIALSKLIANLKTVSSRLIRKEFPYLAAKYFDNKPYFWTGAYFVASCGGVTVEQLKKYVENQNSPKVETLPR
ncbi:MAG: IS200/IS605 family transposase [Microcystis wesenbergii Mw_QC_S_20081001_S30D]|jgi:putative transposase|uniref:IS200/IS605 family transposase n=1 Tax=Microcystis wesenbergii Mw_QC_S_20081001_S30D TaxID=2486245 RepID=A0A552K2C9_9CHRO|nr:IS200/IS605 family transposase [Microcystis aeruginosa W11-03]NCR95117.1 IS200/IS605 family transposase [Microcystis aeruginosa W11-06]TRU98689.1 MAG: IS200/IS605 family transposase [Microcystis wesenbergii Mw_QC_S_20081001_S30]TRU99760.1 MAG: IS200/IS605 family transposase [Microcystis wesenbergii Mw_QC_B_20070930_S4D]TRV01895.1 MAG: IS200/IS605 family transposase [Microcystis wesenbergii Mw_QC_S_20081001_S30D]